MIARFVGEGVVGSSARMIVAFGLRLRVVAFQWRGVYLSLRSF